ncbi:hypothetical protein Tco_0931200 [Tanacetum coccineum]
MSEPMPSIPTLSPFTYPNPNPSASPSFTQDDTSDSFIPEPTQPIPTYHSTCFLHKPALTEHPSSSQPARFGGNEESKKMRKTMLKQQFTEFSVTEEEGLHKGYDRFQKILSQLNQVQARPDNDDINLKFLRALPSSWSQVGIGHSYSVKAAAPTHSAFIGAASSGSKPTYSDQQRIVPSVSQTSGRSDNIMECVLHSFVAENEPDQDMIYEDFDQCNVKTVDDKARYSAFKVTEVKTDKPKALVSVDSMAGIMHAVPPSITGTYKPSPYKSDIEETHTLPESELKNPKFHCWTSVTADGSDPAASRNRPAVNSAGRPKPTERVGHPAGWSKRPAPVSAGRPVSAGWLNPAARPYFRPSSVHFNNMYWPNLYDPMYMNKGRWGTAVKTSAGYSWRNKRPQFWGSKSNGGSHQSTLRCTLNDPQAAHVDGGCSRSMTGTRRADDFVHGQGTHVKIWRWRCRISGKEPHKDIKLDFENVYYVEELSTLLVLFILSAGRLVSAGRTMVLLVVILSAGRLVSAGRTMVLLVVMDYATDSVYLLVGIILLVDSFLLIESVYAANTSIYAAELVYAGSIKFLLANLFLLVVTCFCCAQFVIAGRLVSATSHLVSAGSIQSCWWNNVSAA